MRFLAPHRPKRRRAPFPFFTQNESLQDKSHVLGSSRSLFCPLPRPTVAYGTPPNIGVHPENWSKIINFERLGRRNWSRTKNDDFSVIFHFLEPTTLVSGVVFHEEYNGGNVTGVFSNDKGCIRRFRTFRGKIRPKFGTSSPYISTGTGNTEERCAPSFQARKTMQNHI